MSSERKMSHLDLVLQDPHVDRKGDYFDAIELQPRSFHELHYDEVSLTTPCLGRTLSMPLWIGSMTGGANERLIATNRVFARAAQRQKIALALGSIRPLLEQIDAPLVQKSFMMREEAPDIPIMANIGISQVALGLDLKRVQEALAMIDADALIVHFNMLQELIQPEGERDFRHLKQRLKELTSALSIPVVAKEVGCGFSLEDFTQLHACGIEMIEVAGKGGTSWSRIEHHRRQETLGDDLGLLFQDWGISTIESLLAAKMAPRPLTLIASGGVRSGLDMAKALALGANFVAMARPFLLAAQEGEEALVQLIEKCRQELRAALFLMGLSRVEELIGNDRLWRFRGGTL